MVLICLLDLSEDDALGLLLPGSAMEKNCHFDSKAACDIFLKMIFSGSQCTAIHFLRHQRCSFHPLLLHYTSADITKDKSFLADDSYYFKKYIEQKWPLLISSNF